MDFPSGSEPSYSHSGLIAPDLEPYGEVPSADITTTMWSTEDIPFNWELLNDTELQDEEWTEWMTSDLSDSNGPNPLSSSIPEETIQPHDTVIDSNYTSPTLCSPSPMRKGHLTDVTKWLDGAYSPPTPCTYCRRHRLQCLIIRTTSANPNPVTSCSSCVALFRQCSLAHGEKRQPSRFETLSPVLGNLHGLREQIDDSIPEHPGEHLYLPPIAAEESAPETGGGGSKEPKQFVRKGARILRIWFLQNQDYPYPSEEDKRRLALETGFSRKRISTWFANARRRQKHKADTAVTAAAPELIHRAGSPMPIRQTDSSNGQWPSMTPLERWQASPPEDDHVPESAIKDAIAATNPSTSAIFLDDETGLSSFDENFLSLAETSSPVIGSFRSEASSSESTSSSAWGHYSVSDSGSASFSNSRAQRPIQRRHPSSSPVPSSRSSSRPRTAHHHHHSPPQQYQCTFCPKSFKKRTDWYRHEKTVHITLDKWICTPSLSDLFPNASDNSLNEECRFCSQTPTTLSHWDEHDFRTCAERPPSERSFTRKDHLWQHLRKFHGCTKTPVARLDAWRDETQGYVRSRCGFCGSEMSSWAERGDHLAEHFRKGARMDQWTGDWGLDEDVLKIVRNASLFRT
ncbi:hypothetical protein FE257_012209 [Aspergillus nanangensis]|uniref:Homeobox and C2H2 transcription factor n=1 Tax=Aspergillus nanangensis TaxID=2582783 RepID=A0AAD4CGA9_ASPNN|nr:hypothetical protein FE257_012209 [Aspergillus nanangensis]